MNQFYWFASKYRVIRSRKLNSFAIRVSLVWWPILASLEALSSVNGPTMQVPAQTQCCWLKCLLSLGRRDKTFVEKYGFGMIELRRYGRWRYEKLQCSQCSWEKRRLCLISISWHLWSEANAQIHLSFGQTPEHQIRHLLTHLHILCRGHDAPSSSSVSSWGGFPFGQWAQ